MNLKLSAKKNGNRNQETLRLIFSLWQTPSEITYAALDVGSPIDEDGIPQQYKNFVLSFTQGEEGKFYQPQTALAYEHLLQLKEWLKKMENEGFRVSWTMG